MKGLQRKICLFASGLCLCLLTSCTQDTQTENIRKVDTAMGTIISQNLYVTKTGRESGKNAQEGGEGLDSGLDAQEGGEGLDSGLDAQEGGEVQIGGLDAQEGGEGLDSGLDAQEGGEGLDSGLDAQEGGEVQIGGLDAQAGGLDAQKSVDKQEGGLAVQDAVMELIDRLESDTLSWRLETSEIWEINNNAGSDQGTETSPRLAEELEQIFEISRESKGALDVTVGDVVRLWDIDEYASGGEEGFTPPDAETVRQALLFSGFERVKIEDGRIFLPEGMKLDLGAVGKGLACGRIAGLLAGRPEVAGAVISLGGSVLTYGEKPDQTPWKVGILDPADPENFAGTLTLTGQWFISTSGDYERYVEVDGRRYHHIIDPDTGFPADSGVRSVTILARDGLLTDALSTACFVLGTEDGLKLAERYEAEALFIDSQGVITMTEGMEGYFREK